MLSTSYFILYVHIIVLTRYSYCLVLLQVVNDEIKSSNVNLRGGGALVELDAQGTFVHWLLIMAIAPGTDGDDQEGVAVAVALLEE
jgi:hypothetical protein